MNIEDLKYIFLKQKNELTIDEDKIDELLSKGTILVDEASTKEFADIFITYGVNFKCEYTGESFQVTLLQ